MAALRRQIRPPLLRWLWVWLSLVHGLSGKRAAQAARLARRGALPGMSEEASSAERSSPHDGLPDERRGWAAAAIFTALAVASLDTAIANIALPAIAADLHVSPSDAIWVVNVYQIVLVATLLPLGALGEIVGHERIYLGGLALFTLGIARMRPGLVAGKPAGRPHPAGAGRRRVDEREYRAGSLRVPEPPVRTRGSATMRWWLRRRPHSGRPLRPASWRWDRGPGCSRSTFRSASSPSRSA